MSFLQINLTVSINPDLSKQKKQQKRVETSLKITAKQTPKIPIKPICKPKEKIQNGTKNTALKVDFFIQSKQGLKIRQNTPTKITLGR